jgi:hypothetical protein
MDIWNRFRDFGDIAPIVQIRTKRDDFIVVIEFQHVTERNSVCGPPHNRFAVKISFTNDNIPILMEPGHVVFATGKKF